MMSDRILAFFGDRLGFRPTGRALLRIGVWMVVTTIVVANLVPEQRAELSEIYYNRTVPSDDARTVGLQSDPRGFQPTDPGDDTFRIAWVGESSLQQVDPADLGFIPVDVAENIPTIDGKPVSIDMFFLTALRVIDQFVAVSEAIESGADMIVVAVNPIWTLSDITTENWTNLDGQLVEASAWPPSAWPVSASVAGPADVLWAVVGQRLDSVEDRYYWGTSLGEKVEGWTLLDSVEPPKNDDPSELARIAAKTTPTDFWAQYVAGLKPGTTKAEREALLFERSVEHPSALNRAVLANMAAAIEDADIPTFFYVPPINNEAIADPRTDEALRGVELALAEVAKDFPADITRFETDNLTRLIGDLNFQDLVHLNDISPVVELLTGDLCEFIIEQGHDPECGGPDE